jgi:hypothetical protein
MDRLSELGTARGFAERRVRCAKRELGEAEAELIEANIAYWSYVNNEPCPDCGHSRNCHAHDDGCYLCGCLT